MQKPHFAVGADDAQFHIVRPAPLQCFGQPLFLDLPIVGMDHLLQFSLT